MSYANVASHNAPPTSQQPKPDQGLLNTNPPTTSLVAEDSQKVNVVAPNFKDEPMTSTSEKKGFVVESDSEYEHENVNGSEKKKRRERQLKNVEKEAEGIWENVKERVLQPGVAGGLIGVVNVGILGYASYALYAKPSLRQDTRALTLGSVSLLALFGVEGFAAERYAQTPRGKSERKRAKKDGAAVYRQSREAILRPGVLGGLAGLVNIGVLSGVGYVAYTNWDKPSWDRRVVSAVSVGLLGLWTAEGAVAEKYRDSRK